MKKTSLLLTALLAIALSACGKKDEPAPVAEPAPASQSAAPVQEAAIEKTEEAKEDTAAQAGTALDAAVDKARVAAEQAREVAGTATEAAKETAKALTEEAKTLTEEAKAAVESATEGARETAAAAMAAVSQAVSPATLSPADAENLAKAKNCMACHAVDRKLVGPAYNEVAEKRAGDADAVAVIAAKIRAGGSGVYGPVPMPPNPQVSETEAAQLAQWVLSLK